eukprot:3376046-Prymnesium_polylepis.1
MSPVEDVCRCNEAPACPGNHQHARMHGSHFDVPPGPAHLQIDIAGVWAGARTRCESGMNVL